MSYDPKPRPWFVKLLLISPVFILGILFSLGFSTAMHFTNEMEFCTSCHSMQTNLREYKETIHYKNHSGVRATCADCHVPKAFLPKMVAKIMAAKDVFHELLGTLDTPESYEKHRWGMATKVWAKMKATDSRECRNCHSWEAMKLKDQVKIGRKKHVRAQKKGMTCIDCHKGIAHEEPDEPDEDETQQTSSVLSPSNHVKNSVIR